MNIDTIKYPERLFGTFFRSSPPEDSTGSSRKADEERIHFSSANGIRIELCAKRQLKFSDKKKEYVPIAIRNKICYLKIDDFKNKNLVSESSLEEAKRQKNLQGFLAQLFNILLIDEIYRLSNLTSSFPSRENKDCIQRFLDSLNLDIYNSAEEIISIIEGLKILNGHLNQEQILEIALPAITFLLPLHRATTYPLSLLNRHYYAMRSSRDYKNESEIALTMQRAHANMLDSPHFQKFLTLGINSDRAFSFFIEAERLTTLLENELKIKEFSDEAAKMQANHCSAYLLELVANMQPTSAITLKSGLSIMRFAKELLVKENGNTSKILIPFNELSQLACYFRLSWEETISLSILYKHGCSTQTIRPLLRKYRATTLMPLVMQTLTAIAVQLNESGMKTEIYHKREGRKHRRTTFAFAITHSDIYIVIKERIIGQGSSKEVTGALSLRHPDKEFIRAKPNFKTDTPANERMRIVQGMLHERMFLQDIHRNLTEEEAQYFAPPHTAHFLTQRTVGTPRCILFQEK